MKKFTVTLSVSAYNEARNIERFLKSVIAQKEEGFKLDKILIISDGSTDNTVELLKSIKSSKLKVIAHNKREGKSTRLNEIYSMVESDFLVQSDADVIFAHSYVIRDIIKPLIEQNDVGMCGGYPIPLKGKTFTEKADASTFVIYSKLLKFMKGGNNIFSADGRILCYRKELFKRIRIPHDMITNDMYTYYSCIALGFKYKFVPSATVYFRAPQTLEDKIKQNLRSASAPARMKRYFLSDVVEREFNISKTVRIKSIILQLINDPVKSLYIYLVNKYCHIRAREAEKYLTAKWDMAESTKSLN